MTLSLDLPPEVAARLEAEAKQRGVSLSEYALQKLIQPQETAGEAILQMVEEIYGALPEEEQDKLPPDYAKNYKHYLHGAPKAEE